MDYAKFADLIKKSALYFCRIDCFYDKLEATQPEGGRQFARISENPWQVHEMQITDKQLEIIRNLTFANCWHMNQQENPNMWENYVLAHGKDGIAIQTNFKRLSECFLTEKILTNLKMKYVDYSKEHISYFMPNYFDFLSIKDMEFEYENELRIITLEKEYPQFDPDEMDMSTKITFNNNKGELIRVNLNVLIQNIYISPNATKQFKDSVSRLLEENKIKAPVISSSF